MKLSKKDRAQIKQNARHFKIDMFKNRLKNHIEAGFLLSFELKMAGLTENETKEIIETLMEDNTYKHIMDTHPMLVQMMKCVGVDKYVDLPEVVVKRN